MKFYILLSLVLQPSPPQIRIMTYNIDAEKQGDGSYNDILEVIKAINPDVCGLQKLDSFNSRNPNDVLKQLGDQTGYSTTFAPAIQNYNGSSGSYGIGFLTKNEPIAKRRLLIEHREKEQDRAALEISLMMGNENVRVVVTHLAHEGDSYRISQINKIISWINSIDTTDPVLIIGDFNASPNDSSMRLLENAGFQYVKGKNGEILDTSAHQNINHILYRPAPIWEIMDADNPYYAASNRNPVWADVNLKTITETYNEMNISKKIKNQSRFFKNVLFEYNLYNNSIVSISIYDICGRLVKHVLKRKYQSAGIHAISIDNFYMPNGFYNIVLHTNYKKYNLQLSQLK